ncbi:hypothetical protein BEP19_02500 [Ammoniphilus oxalaticus]|uniref:Uncharacterized protein n=1 Tax=Ammoniphilus oxalaticus TaxID=66863 RepID=A0A419SNG7_9BACL|nr:hypothetical protein [Ammoniphilus oxalaticus]RKD25825.1 hypothetical protein BEP19_02500 [Ammoniphilus oxalaticus]
MAETYPEKSEKATVTTIKKNADRTSQLKVLSLIFMFIMFTISFFALKSGNETFMWIALGLMVASAGFLYARN